MIKTRLRNRWDIVDYELADWEHDVCIHLITLPNGSVFRRQGCVDRISTYDPQKRGGGSEVLFISYVHLLIDNFCRSVLRHKRFVPNVVVFSDLIRTDSSEDSLDQEELLAKLSAAFASQFDPVQSIWWKDLAERSAKIDPAFPNAIWALMTHSNQREAALHLGVTEKVFSGMLKHVKALACGEHLQRRRRRNRTLVRLAA